MSRIDPIMKNLIGTESPDDLATRGVRCTN